MVVHGGVVEVESFVVVESISSDVGWEGWTEGFAEFIQLLLIHGNKVLLLFKCQEKPCVTWLLLQNQNRLNWSFILK